MEQVKPLTESEEAYARAQWLDPTDLRLFATLDRERALRVEAERQRDEACAGESARAAERDAAMLAGVRAMQEHIADMIEHDELSAVGDQPLNKCGLPEAIRALDAEAIAARVKP